VGRGNDHHDDDDDDDDHDGDDGDGDGDTCIGERLPCYTTHHYIYYITYTTHMIR